MKILITTQVVDSTDPVLGFFHRWLEEFAKHCEHIEVICLYEGQHSLPSNVAVHSLGKEKGRALPLVYAWHFLRLLFQLRNSYDEVFVHMNPEYVLLGGLWWRLWHKRIALWYLHKSVDLKLRIATQLADVVFTASKESFRLQSPKVHIVGHGIDVDTFVYATPMLSPDSVRLITVGRISPAKKPHVLIAATGILAEKLSSQEPKKRVQLDIVGGTISESDRVYTKTLEAQITTLPSDASAILVGPKTNNEIAQLLGEHDLFLHASTGTGSLDKTVLESLLCGVPVVSSSEAFRDLLSPYGLYVEEGSDSETAERIATAAITLLNRPDREIVRRALRETVVVSYSLKNLIPRILGTLEQ